MSLSSNKLHCTTSSSNIILKYSELVIFQTVLPAYPPYYIYKNVLVQYICNLFLTNMLTFIKHFIAAVCVFSVLDQMLWTQMVLLSWNDSASSEYISK